MSNSLYIEWLKKQRVPLFESGGIYWRLYRGALIPAPVTPCYVELGHEDAKALLGKSGAHLLRYSSDPCEQETEWWYIECDSYDLKEVSSKTRGNINRGKRKCFVRQVDAEWLAKYGYKCYSAAFSRYMNARPVNEDIFRNGILRTVGGPFQYWGVFVETNLAGYCECIVEETNVATSTGKYHPVYLKYRIAEVITDNILNHYVAERGMRVSNGNRSISHDTNMQDFLLKFGFRKQYCRLNIVYQPWLSVAIQAIFPLRKLIIQLPERGPIHKLQSLLFQEELHRKCCAR